MKWIWTYKHNKDQIIRKKWDPISSTGKISYG